MSHACFPASGSLKQMAFSLILYIAVLLYLSLHVTRLFIRTPDRLDPRSTQLQSNLTLNNYTHSDPVYKSGMGGFGLNAGTWWWGGETRSITIAYVIKLIILKWEIILDYVQFSRSVVSDSATP